MKIRRRNAGPGVGALLARLGRHQTLEGDALAAVMGRLEAGTLEPEALSAEQRHALCWSLLLDRAACARWTAWYDRLDALGKGAR